MLKKEEILKELVDKLRCMMDNGTHGTLCWMPFEGVAYILEEAFEAGRNQELADVRAYGDRRVKELNAAGNPYWGANDTYADKADGIESFLDDIEHKAHREA